MASYLTEVLNADGMFLQIFCGGQSKVGIDLTGTWVGTVTFSGSVDGLNFIPINVTPFASGTGVNQVTANGTWESVVGNFTVIRATFSRTSGSAAVIMTASIDSSYQDAFITTSVRYPNSIATNATNTLTQAAQANRAWRLKTLKITTSSQPSWLTSPNVTINDGSTALWAFDLPPQGSSGIVYDIVLPSEGIIGSPGNAMSIVLPAGGAGCKTSINAEFEPK
jgi:hypothetical protein